MRAFLRRPRTWLIGIPVLILLAVVVAPYVYIHFIQGDPPAKLSFDDVTSTTSADGATDTSSATSTTAASSEPLATDALSGTWTVAEGSLAGYRAKEILFGQDATAVGRTSDVTGTFVLDGTVVAAASFEVDMTTVSSDESRRDGQFRNRIMDVSQFPTATFELTDAITLDAIPADLDEVTVSASGEFTIHGVTRSVTFDLTARRNGSTIELQGLIPVVFSDYEIDNPSGGPATVGDNGEIEFLLVLELA